MAKSKVFWITRDVRKKAFYEVWFYRDYPKRDVGGTYWDKQGDDDSTEFCPKLFEALTGITLAPGQRVKAQLVIKE